LQVNVDHRMLGDPAAIVDGKEEGTPENLSVDNGIDVGDKKV